MHARAVEPWPLRINGPRAIIGHTRNKRNSKIGRASHSKSGSNPSSKMTDQASSDARLRWRAMREHPAEERFKGEAP